ncbi:hypothetical protein M8J76_006181 [Diaphorina citri]|nr:hypothetical protein M8J76_006181 [Diaphorina citri]
MYNLGRILPVVCHSLKKYPLLKYHTRNLRTQAPLQVGAYDSDGKTTVSVINKEFVQGILIDTVNQFGFRLSNNSVVVGPLAVFNKCVFSWNILDDSDINMKSLSLFLHLEPKLDVLIIGLGDFKFNHTKLIPVINEVRKHCNVEVLPTERAIATFNFMVSEGRVAGAALVPPVRISFTEEDIQATKHQNRDVYKLDIKIDV